MRVKDTTVSDWLLWARHFGEIISYRVGKGDRRRIRVRVTPGVTRDGSPFRPKEGILDIFGHTADDVVPAELMFTAREALAFGMGCAAGRAAALMEREEDWQRDREAEWTPAARTEFARRREEARAQDRRDRERGESEREAERLRRVAAYRRRKEAEARALESGKGALPPA